MCCICIVLVLEQQSAIQGGRGWICICVVFALCRYFYRTAVNDAGKEKGGIRCICVFALVFLLNGAGREGVDWTKKEKEKRPLVKQKKCVADPSLE